MVISRIKDIITVLRSNYVTENITHRYQSDIEKHNTYTDNFQYGYSVVYVGPGIRLSSHIILGYLFESQNNGEQG